LIHQFNTTNRHHPITHLLLLPCTSTNEQLESELPTMSIRIERGAVYLPASCIEQWTSVRDEGDQVTNAEGGPCSCLPRRRRRRAGIAGADANADVDAVARLPLSRLVGAEEAERGRMRVWFTAQEDAAKDKETNKKLRGYVCQPPLEVRISAPVDAAAAGGGERLVAALRAAAASASASGAPPNARPPPPAPRARVVAIVNPASGRGRAARDL
jgi:hypothetical protein